MMRRLDLYVLGSVLLAVPATTPAVAGPPEVSCHADGGFLVISRERAAETGSDFLVRRVQGASVPKPCRFVAKPGDIRVPASAKVENAWYYLGMSGGRMALDEGTASQNRRLVIVDHSTGKVAATYDTFETARVSDEIAYVTVAGERGSPQACPDMEPDLVASSRIVKEISVDLRTLKATPLNTGRCAYEE